jgi:hypothetical protein
MRLQQARQAMSCNRNKPQRLLRTGPATAFARQCGASALPKTFTEKLHNRARREGTTVHGALLAALAIVGAGVSPHWRGIPIRVLSPINVRGAPGAGEDCDLLVGAATNGLNSGDFDGSPARFWNLARHAKTGVASGQTEQGIVTVMSA